MVFTRKTFLKKTLQGGLKTVMEVVNPLLPERAQSRDTRSSDISNVNDQGENPKNQRDHIYDDRDAENNEEEEDDEDYAHDRYYKDSYYYEGNMRENPLMLEPPLLNRTRGRQKNVTQRIHMLVNLLGEMQIMSTGLLRPKRCLDAMYEKEKSEKQRPRGNDHRNNLNDKVRGIDVSKSDTKRRIMEAPLTVHFKMPKIELYDGCRDPKTHIYRCNKMMEVAKGVGHPQVLGMQLLTHTALPAQVVVIVVAQGYGNPYGPSASLKAPTQTNFSSYAATHTRCSSTSGYSKLKVLGNNVSQS
uniref:Uncharacterized protein n=1 Tax=Cannabis sativa TaxID=3483 RepID=A0A803P4K8_CANSA